MDLKWSYLTIIQSQTHIYHGSVCFIVQIKWNSSKTKKLDAWDPFLIILFSYAVSLNSIHAFILAFIPTTKLGMIVWCFFSKLEEFEALTDHLFVCCIHEMLLILTSVALITADRMAYEMKVTCYFNIMNNQFHKKGDDFALYRQSNSFKCARAKLFFLWIKQILKLKMKLYKNLSTDVGLHGCNLQNKIIYPLSKFDLNV